jgi:hypothetical protein
LEIVLAAMKLTGLLLQVPEKPFRGKLGLCPKQIAKRRQPLRVIREVVFAI